MQVLDLHPEGLCEFLTSSPLDVIPKIRRTSAGRKPALSERCESNGDLAWGTYTLGDRSAPLDSAHVYYGETQ
jgi:hypothetical protein